MPLRIKANVCRALGLDPLKVQSLKIILDGDWPRIEVTHLLFDARAQRLVEELRRYQLGEL
jgi:hypothetical protein